MPKPLDIVIRETYDQTRVLFFLIRALQVEVSELRAELATHKTEQIRLLQASLTLSNPLHDEAVKKDYGTSDTTQVGDKPHYKK
jgi:hypothetical protein